MKLIELLYLGQEKNLFHCFDVQFAKVIAREENSILMLAAALLSRDVGAGHICLPLSQIHPDFFFYGLNHELAQAMWQAINMPKDVELLLYMYSAVSDGTKASPLVLKNQRLYLHHMWKSEEVVLDFIRYKSFLVHSEEGKIREILDFYFGQEDRLDWQKIAAAVALTSQISVISGGPGTGKTTTVAKILASLINLSLSPQSIKVVAPTGKAASRLTKELGLFLQNLILDHRDLESFPLEATTLHRLLGAKIDSQHMYYNSCNTLPVDVLVVDESSMIDLSMFDNLISALPSQTRVIFLGDRDQISSVEAGTVFSDICYYSDNRYSADRAVQLSRLTGCNVITREYSDFSSVGNMICLLHKNYRFKIESGIGQLAEAVNRGNIRLAQKVLTSNFNDITYYTITGDSDYHEILKIIIKGYYDYLRKLKEGSGPDTVLDAFSRFQVLCVLREGLYGVLGMNRSIEYMLYQEGFISHEMFLDCPWYHGRPVMILHNSKELKLSNGDIGIAIKDEHEQLQVWFLLSNGGMVAIDPARLPLHQTAFVITVHKAQGSEFENVVLVLPTQVMPILTRKLFYTAITRAKKFLTICANQLVLESSIRMNVKCQSGLAHKIHH
ncbi:RecBCD enzyme subunit RecD [Candidatus Erwinia haradaeae]|uniref:RecBCD enzyme subunit RecD n=1 Tax=Candidatus Erwinia haradaeae TaxID=1922217 RepID=A0A451CZV9_9GAMM|nr:RecBCD enzyme subunit RecD [Candidatus Erwinia haradaeae]